MSLPPRFQLAHSDAVEWLRTLPSNHVDLMITDPPYESLEKHRAIGTTTRLKHSKASSNNWFQVFPNSRFEELFSEVWRVLKKDSHFYLFCDQETMFVAKPIAEQQGFKFWKPLVWDKCLGPDTLVRTSRGVIRAAEVVSGDEVYTPQERSVPVLACRKTRAPALRIMLSTGLPLLASREHKFLLTDGRQVEASELGPGTKLASGCVEPAHPTTSVSLEELLDQEDRVVEMPEPSVCLFCGREFEGSRAAAAHQARFCEIARSKEAMAQSLGIAPKRLRRWMNEGRLPAAWAEQLGLLEVASGQSQIKLQNDLIRWFPAELKLDYGWGKWIGLYAAEGFRTDLNVVFCLHREEKHLQNLVLRMARVLGVQGTVSATSENGVTVSCGSKVLSRLVEHFVGGRSAEEKYFKSSVYGAPIEFQRGVFDGLLEGEGHWSREEQGETLNVASSDLASFALRFARFLGWEATLRRHENSTSGFYRVCFDPAKAAEPVTVVSVEDTGEIDLVDIAIDDPAQLYQLHDGVITHNCKIGMGYHYRARYEFILFFEKGKRKLNNLGIADVITHPRIHKGYPTEKPVEVSEVLVHQSSEPGQLIVDPFVGSASSGVAAARNGRNFLGSDLSLEALTLARGRLLAAGGVEQDLPKARTAERGQLSLSELRVAEFA